MVFLDPGVGRGGNIEDMCVSGKGLRERQRDK